MARALFKSWFVDFDPVRAKLEGRAVALYRVAAFVNGGAYRDEDFVDAAVGLPIVKIAELKSGVIDQTRYAVPGRAREVRIDSGDMLCRGRATPTPPSGRSSGSAVRRCSTNTSSRWSSRATRTGRGGGVCWSTFGPYPRISRAGIQTTGLGRFTIADMKRLLVVRPSPKCLTVFHCKVTPMLRRHPLNLRESRTHAALRDALLARLFSGELRGRDAREIDHYNLDVIISVEYRVKSRLGTRFRIRATQRLREYLVKGFTLDDARLKRGGGATTSTSCSRASTTSARRRRCSGARCSSSTRRASTTTRASRRRSASSRPCRTRSTGRRTVTPPREKKR